MSGTFVYAAVEAMRVILEGGSTVAAGGLAAYGAVSGLVAPAVWGCLLRSDPAADLLRAEQPIRELVDRVRTAAGLPKPVPRATKVARALDVDVGFVVPPRVWDLADEDRVRRSLRDALADLPYDPWIVVEITTDADLV